jgi:uncharacterized protein (TIGR02246 family)
MNKIVIIALLFFPFISHSQTGAEKQIRTILDAQISAWNKGDLPKFMQGYWNNDSLMFIGKTGVTYGYQATLDRYEKNYPDPDSRGTLTFDIIKMNAISPDYYWVLGRYALTRNKGNVSGHFTLLFKKINGNWKIIADHSS